MEHITVLLSSYNGEKYIREQLDSVLAQRNVTVSILVRDDGSKDGTTEILDEYQSKGLIEWYSGENVKPAKSFMDLMRHAPKSDYYALCDQDDYWLPDKLIRAISNIKEQDYRMPLLYYGRPRIVDKELKNAHLTKNALQKMTSFGSSLVCSNATGCTMVFNNELMKYLQLRTPNNIIMHDAWLHKLCLALGGKVIFDEDVHILYRQHEKNVIGIDSSICGRISRGINRVIKAGCSESRMIQSLREGYGDIMPRDNLELVEIVCDYKKNIKNRVKLIFSKKIKTTYIERDFVFILQVIVGSY